MKINISFLDFVELNGICFAIKCYIKSLIYILILLREEKEISNNK